jgi:hypothetical protein
MGISAIHVRSSPFDRAFVRLFVVQSGANRRAVPSRGNVRPHPQAHRFGGPAYRGNVSYSAASSIPLIWSWV